MSGADPRIVHVASGREWRGGQRQVFLLCRELGRRGLAQMVITTAGSRLEAALRQASVPVQGVAWRRGLSAAAALAAHRAAGPGTILHAHDGHAVTLASLATLVRKAPLVATRRTGFPLRHGLFWRRADRVTAVSDAVRRRLRAAGVEADRVTVVHSAVDVEAARRVRPEGERRRLRLPDDVPLAVTASALTSEKGLEVLVAAAAILARSHPGLHWAIAGDGPLQGTLSRQISDLGLSRRIHLVGWLDDPLPLIAAADIYVSPSHAEGFGTAILEAMAMAIPIVGTAVGGVPELLEGGAGLLVPPAAPGALADAVARLLTEPDLHRTVAARAARRAQRFGPEGMADGVLSVYRSLTLAVGTQ